MYHSKKFLAMLLAVLMLISLAGCGGSNDPVQTPTKATEPAKPTQPAQTQPAENLSIHENTYFTVGYAEEDGWTLAEDDYSTYESGGDVYLRILDADGYTEHMVEIQAYEDDHEDFRYDLHFNGFDQKAYVDGSLETVTIGGQTMVYVDRSYGERYFFGRNEAAGVTYSILAGSWEDPRVQKVVENITFTISGTDNIDPPWPWEGAPFSGGTLTQTVGTFTLTAEFLPMAEPFVTYETFDHDIAVIGDKVYLLSDGGLYQYAYGSGSLELLKQIPLNEEYTILEKNDKGELVLSNFMEPVIGHDGESTLYSYEGPEKFSVSPDGTWGISWFVSGDECQKYTFADGTLTGEDIAFSEVDTLSQICIDRNYILVSGSSAADDEHYLFVYDHSGNLKLQLAGEPDGFGLGSITYAVSTPNGFLALDGNMREVVLWTADGTWIGAADDGDLFGTGYPWIAAADVAADGSIFIVMSDTRQDESADEVLVFKLSGF